MDYLTDNNLETLPANERHNAPPGHRKDIPDYSTYRQLLLPKQKGTLSVPVQPANSQTNISETILTIEHDGEASGRISEILQREEISDGQTSLVYRVKASISGREHENKIQVGLLSFP